MMITPLPTGPYPYAGVPWFNTPFGMTGFWWLVRKETTAKAKAKAKYRDLSTALLTKA
jgi:hypothetical protein